MYVSGRRNWSFSHDFFCVENERVSVLAFKLVFCRPVNWNSKCEPNQFQWEGPIHLFDMTMEVHLCLHCCLRALLFFMTYSTKN